MQNFVNLRGQTKPHNYSDTGIIYTHYPQSRQQSGYALELFALEISAPEGVRYDKFRRHFMIAQAAAVHLG